MHPAPAPSWRRPAGAPDFNNLLAVLRRECPTRPTLFEFHLNPVLSQAILGSHGEPEWCSREQLDLDRRLFPALGYDYVLAAPFRFAFATAGRDHDASVSLNDGAVISDRASFERYVWPEPVSPEENNRFDEMPPPNGCKYVMHSPGGGQLETIIALLGFDRLCLMLADDPELVQDIADGIGSRLLAFYTHYAASPHVGAVIVNDDWGFRTATMLSPRWMKRLVFPWHDRIVSAIHAAGKPAILHSCGNLAQVMDEVIDGLKYDAKHSYEDAILPVEEAYERWGRRIAIVGGMDIDFVCRRPMEEIYQRAGAMLDRTRERGGYALGTGNSVPAYMPNNNYLAMTAAVLDRR